MGGALLDRTGAILNVLRRAGRPVTRGEIRMFRPCASFPAQEVGRILDELVRGKQIECKLAMIRVGRSGRKQAWVYGAKGGK